MSHRIANDLGWLFLVAATVAIGYVGLGLVGLAPASSATPEHGHAGPRGETPLPASARQSVEATGPAESRWALRSFATAEGQVCVQEGQLVAGRFGRQLADRFVERELTDSGMCGQPNTSWASVTRHFDDPRTPGHERPVTLVFGQLEPGANGAVVINAGGALRHASSRDGMFLLVLGAVPRSQDITVEMPTANGETERAIL